MNRFIDVADEFKEKATRHKEERHPGDMTKEWLNARAISREELHEIAMRIVMQVPLTEFLIRPQVPLKMAIMVGYEAAVKDFASEGLPPLQ